MKKLLFSLLMILVLCVGWSTSALATEAMLIDDANVLSADELVELTDKLDAANQKHDVDIIIVTSSYGSYQTYDNAVVLDVAIKSRDVTITATGDAEDIFSDNEIDEILDAIEDDLHDDNYADAIDTYIEECDQRLETGKSFDSVALMYLGVSLVIGLVVALVATGIMAAKLKSVRSKAGASDYVKAGSLNVTLSRDMFLYRKVDRRAKPKQSSSSSGGFSGNSRSRKF